MDIDLPKPAQDYFQAANAGDIPRMIAPFAEHARVHDEGADIVGRAAIQAWMEDTTRKYGARAIPEGIVLQNGTTAVTALVSGNFPGSPVHLTYRFGIQNDEIVTLEIG